MFCYNVNKKNLYFHNLFCKIGIHRKNLEGNVGRAKETWSNYQRQGCRKNFIVGKNDIVALKKVSLDVRATDFIILYGPSGCGKSTLFNIILGLDKPTKGEVVIRDTKIYNMDDDERSTFRSKKIGMIYQMPYWIKSGLIDKKCW